MPKQIYILDKDAVIISGDYILKEPYECRIRLCARQNARGIKARWRGAVLNISVPPWISANSLIEFLTKRQHEIVNMQPTISFVDRTIIDCIEVDICVCRDTSTTLKPRELRINRNSDNPQRGKMVNYHVLLGSEVIKRIAEPEVQKCINRMVITCANHAARTVLLNFANTVAQRLGIFPKRWEVKDSVAKLGSCSADGIITLSPRLMFMPVELREYIICHELSHLTHLNHSADFHELCNRYLAGREKELSRQCKAFKFPIIF